jgi:deoxyribonuclease V
VSAWPATAEALIAVQQAIAIANPARWKPAPDVPLNAASAWVCFEQGHAGVGAAGDPAWAAAVLMRGRKVAAQATVHGVAGAPYMPGLLALRTGALLVSALTSLAQHADVLVIDATGRDHPRGAGLATHLGAVLDLPSVGVTHRPLRATGDWPADIRGARSPLILDGQIVGHWVRTRAGRRPIAVHAGWRTDPDTAITVVLACTGRMRTPTPLRQARRLARQLRAQAQDRPARVDARSRPTVGPDRPAR